MVTKNVDSEGRVHIGRRFANRTVVVQETDGPEVRLVLVPEREAWLLENQGARTSILRGVEQAKARQFSQSPPDPGLDSALADDLEDER